MGWSRLGGDRGLGVVGWGLEGKTIQSEEMKKENLGIREEGEKYKDRNGIRGSICRG